MHVNTKMKQLLEGTKIDKLKIDNLISCIEIFVNPKFKCIYGCILIDKNNSLMEEKVNIQKILNMYGDKTGYESSFNEIRINDYLEDEELTEVELIQIGLTIIDYWKNKLNQSFHLNQYSFILVSDGGYVTLRFHLNRNDEKKWLSNDLEKYQEAIAEIVG